MSRDAGGWPYYYICMDGYVCMYGNGDTQQGALLLGIRTQNSAVYGHGAVLLPLLLLFPGR